MSISNVILIKKKNEKKNTVTLKSEHSLVNLAPLKTDSIGNL